MASPQKENGYTIIANEILEELAKLDLGYSGTGHALILFVLRKTYGFHKKEDKISISQFQEALNLSRRTIIYSLQELEAKNILIIKREKIGLKSEINLIKFNKNYDTWVVQNSAHQVKNNRIKAKLNSAKLRKDEKYREGSAKPRQGVVQNSPLGVVHSFAPTKETNTKETNTKERAASPQKNMKYNENDFSNEGLPDIDDNTGDIRPELPKAGPWLINLILWAEKKKGSQFANRGKQAKAISGMKKAGYSVEMIQEKWEELEKDDYWRKQGFDFSIVLNEISKVKKKRLSNITLG